MFSPIQLRRRAPLALLLVALSASAAMASPASANSSHADTTHRSASSGVAGYANVDINTIDPSSAYDSSGGAVTVDNPSPGQYTVRFAGLASSGGVAQVTSYGLGVAENKSCSLDEWIPSGSDELVMVNCFGVDTPYPPDDSTFGVSFTAPTTVSKMAYLWADQPSNAEYIPALPWNFNSTGSPNMVLRQGTGAYDVYLPNLASKGGTIQVSAYGSDPKTCSVFSWHPSTSNPVDLQVNVRCWTPTGALIDSYFALTFVQNNDILGQSIVGGYLADNNAKLPSQTLKGPRQWASGGPTSPTIVRTSVGVYQITLPNVPDGGSGNRGVATVTPIGLNYGAYCVIPGYGHDLSGAVIAEVDCFKTVNPVDVRFTFQYVRHV